MKRIDIAKKHQVTLTFLLDEEVSPLLFAQRIVLACGGSTLRPGEGVLLHNKNVCLVMDETLSMPSFGYEWQCVLEKKTLRERLIDSRKKPRRKRP